MEYKMVINNEGVITTDVVNRGIHKCDDILNVTTSLGTIVKRTKKDDKVPVHERINIKGN